MHDSLSFVESPREELREEDFVSLHLMDRLRIFSDPLKVCESRF